MSKVHIIVKCVGCGATKVVGSEQKTLPMCEADFMPMIVVEAEAVRKPKQRAKEARETVGS